MDDLWVVIRSAYFYVHNSSLQIDENNFCGGLTFRIFTLFLPDNFRLPFRFPFFPNGNLCFFCPMSFFFFSTPWIIASTYGCCPSTFFPRGNYRPKFWYSGTN